MRARARGNYRSAVQQKDSTTVTINTVMRHQIDLPPGSTAAFKTIPVWQALRDSQFYANYAPMYDQVKLVGVRAKINGAIQGTNINSYLTPTVATAWDRNGTSATPTIEQIYTYSSLITKAWSLGNSFITSRSIYPSTMAEKSQYVATQSINNDNTDLNNPCSYQQVQAIPFKPTLIVAISLPTKGLDIAQAFVWNIEFDITVKFRGLRKGLQPTAPIPAGTISFPVSLDGLSISTGDAAPAGYFSFSNFQNPTSSSSISVPGNSLYAFLIPGRNFVTIIHNGTGGPYSFNSGSTATKYLKLADGGGNFNVFFHTQTDNTLPGITINPNSSESVLTSFLAAPTNGNYPIIV